MFMPLTLREDSMQLAGCCHVARTTFIFILFFPTDTSSALSLLVVRLALRCALVGFTCILCSKLLLLQGKHLTSSYPKSLERALSWILECQWECIYACPRTGIKYLHLFVHVMLLMDSISQCSLVLPEQFRVCSLLSPILPCLLGDLFECIYL